MTRTICKEVLIPCVAMLALGGFQSTALAGQKALLIGINVYPHMLPDKQLSDARQDALSMKEFLVEHWGFSSSDIRLLLDRDATKRKIMDALNNWLPSASGPGDRVVVFFSGHGTSVRDVSGDEVDGKDEAFSPSDSSRRRGVAGLVLDDEIAVAFSRLPGREILLIADSCHSGTVARGAALDMETNAGSATARFLPPRTFESDSESASGAQESTLIIRDEEPMSREVGSLLTLSAAMPYQYAWSTGRGGVFTSRLIEALTNLRADLNGNGQVTTAEVITYMKPKLASWCQNVEKCKRVGFTPNVDPKNETYVLMPPPVDEALPVVEEDDPEAVSDVLPSVEADSISVEIHPDNRHRVGDAVSFTLTSTVDGYLTLLDLTAGGKLMLLFPTDEDVRRGKSGRIRANHPLHVPDKSYGFTFEAAPPIGQGQLIAVVTEDHVDLSDLLEEYGDFESIEDPVKFMKSVSGRLHEVWTGDGDKNRGARWAVGYTDYQISE